MRMRWKAGWGRDREEDAEERGGEMNQEEVGGEGNEEKRGRGWIWRVTRGEGGGEGDMEMGRRMRRRGEGR